MSTLKLEEARSVLRRHRGEFAQISGVVAVSLAVRDERVRFVVSVDSEDAAGRVAALGRGEIDGYPLYVEVVEALAASSGEHASSVETRSGIETAWSSRPAADRFDGLIFRLLHRVAAVFKRSAA